MPFIQTISHSEAEGQLKDIYDDIVNKRGKLAEVHKIQSLNPDTIVHHMDLYMAIMYKKSPLTRAQREMIAVVVSVANKCTYCRHHHAEALLFYWKDPKKLDSFIKDYNSIDLSEVDLNLCLLAKQLTEIPGSSTEKLIAHIKELGLEDRAILDATLVIAYFNFVNRIVLGLGVAIEADQGQGYKF